MMGYGDGWGLPLQAGMMGGAGLWGGLVGLVILIDLVLVGIWLWQNISKK